MTDWRRRLRKKNLTQCPGLVDHYTLKFESSRQHGPFVGKDLSNLRRWNRAVHVHMKFAPVGYIHAFPVFACLLGDTGIGQHPWQI